MTDAAFDVTAYLRRLGVDAHTGPPSWDLLAHLQLAHLVAVPFENLHVYHRRGVRTDVAWSYEKVVAERRGGWCFELNGCFAELLRRLGFGVDLVSCRVWEAPKTAWGPELDHLALVVHLDGARWLVDVGFGDSCIHPLLLETGERPAVPRRARLEVDDSGFVLTELVPLEAGPVEWEPQLHGSFAPRVLDDFAARSTFLQTEPGLSWSEKPFATRAVDGTGSRITLRRSVLRRRRPDGEVDEHPVAPEAWSGVLDEHFGLVDTVRSAR